MQKILAVQYRLDLDINNPVFDHRIVCLDWYHAGRTNHFTGADIESSLVKVAFDHLAFQNALGQRSRPMCTSVIRDEQPTVDIVYSKNQTCCFYLYRFANSNFVFLAERYPRPSIAYKFLIHVNWEQAPIGAASTPHIPITEGGSRGMQFRDCS